MIYNSFQMKPRIKINKSGIPVCVPCIPVCSEKQGESNLEKKIKNSEPDYNEDEVGDQLKEKQEEGTEEMETINQVF